MSEFNRADEFGKLRILAGYLRNKPWESDPGGSKSPTTAFLEMASPERILRLYDQLDTLREELAAYKKAKAENDERFQLEAGDLRSENARLREVVKRIAEADLSSDADKQAHMVMWCSMVAKARQALGGHE